MPQLDDKDLREIVENPQKFFSVPSNRVRALGMPIEDLKSQLDKFQANNGINAAGTIKEIIKIIEW